MAELVQMTALQLAEELRAGRLTSTEVTEAFLDRIENLNPELNAFITVDRQGALETAALVDEQRASGVELHPLAGVPIAVKDNIVTSGLATSCASRILEGWVPPYDATVITRIREAGLPILGKTNLDEFAMGSSTEFSAFGPTRNPWDPTRTPGGSGGGSAAAVAAFLAPWALGSDTGGSIRQPAAFTGTVGVKPTYGAVSRYGAVALASSLDQVGPVARNVADAAALQDLIGGYDPMDATSLPGETPELLAATAEVGEATQLNGLRVGIVGELSGEEYSEEVLAAFNDTVAKLRQAGAEIVEVDAPSFENAMAAYSVIMAAEASSNLARFDGMRFGLRVEPEEGPVTSESVIAATRGAGFGPEVKRRIILGTHMLSAGFYKSYFEAAQKARTLIIRDFDRIFGQVDVLVAPTTPTQAFELGERTDDPLAMYENDTATVPVNLAGLPALSVPNGVTTSGLPIGLQVVAPAREDAQMYRVAQLVENLVDDISDRFPAQRWASSEVEGE